MIHWLVSPTARHAALSRAQCTASLADHSKVYTSTVALVPPEVAWLPIQQARESLRDKGLYRWPPHINLLYPFVPEEHFAQAADALAPAAAATPPFELTLDTFGVFGGRRWSRVGWGFAFGHVSEPSARRRKRSPVPSLTWFGA